MKVFVSSSRKDAEFVARIQRDLTALGYDVWVDTEDILAGGQARWRRSIVAAIRDSEVMVLVLSPNSTHSENVERELSVAADNSKRVVPIVYQQTELPDGFQYDLAGVQHIDFTTTEFNEGVRRLAAYLGPVQALPPPVAAVIPPPPPAPAAATTTNRWRQPRVLAIAGAALAVLLIGGIVIAAMGGGDGSSASTEPTTAISARVTTTPTTETATSPVAATASPTTQLADTTPAPTTTVALVSEEDQAKAVVLAWTTATSNRDWAEAARLDTSGRIKNYDSWYGGVDAPKHMVSIQPYFATASTDGTIWTLSGAVMAFDMFPVPTLTTNVVCSVFIVDLPNGSMAWQPESRPATRVDALDPSQFESNYTDRCV